MKSVSFFRNTWKKWEQKTSDGRDTSQVTRPPESQKLSHSRSPGRSLTVTVKHLPSEVSSALHVEGTWQPSESYQPPSPIYDQFTLQRTEHALPHRDGDQFVPDVSYFDHEPILHQTPKNPQVEFPPQKPLTYAPNLPHMPSSTINSPFPVVREKRVDSTMNRDPPTHSRNPSRPTGQTTPTLPSFQLLPPIDLNYGPTSKSVVQNSSEAKDCKCGPLPLPRHHSQCPKYVSTHASGSLSPSRSTNSLRNSPKSVNAVLDLCHDANPRSLYLSAGSTPHLPCRERTQSSARSEHSSYSVGSSEAEHFPLSLFPLPPPLIVRKKVPAPLVLRSMTPASAQSSRDSTPVGTPTTPRFPLIHSPTQPSVTSPTKKFYTGRPSASFSPPPFSPPNSPLPKPPKVQEPGRRPSDQYVRPLRTSQSSINFRNVLPFPATHRLTSSEPISDQSSLPIRRPVKPRAIERPKNIQTYLVSVLELERLIRLLLILARWSGNTRPVDDCRFGQSRTMGLRVLNN